MSQKMVVEDISDKKDCLCHWNLDPNKPNGLSHPYQLETSIFHFRGGWYAVYTEC